MFAAGSIEIPVEVSAEVYLWLLKFDPNQPRDEHGRWSNVAGAGTHPHQPRDEHGRWSNVAGAGTHPHRPNEHLAGPVKIRPTKERVFDGKPVATKIKLTNKETDKITEAVVLQHLRLQGFKDAEVASTIRGYTGGNNYAMDAYADHIAVEIKGGQISNGRSAQHWRVKYGEESRAFGEWKKTAKPEQVSARREALANKCLADKEKARKWLEKDRGKKVSAVTYTAIVNPDTRHVDVYRFKNYHLRLGWRQPQTKAAYVRSYKY